MRKTTIECKSCKRYVKAIILKSWSKSDQDGDSYDVYAKVALLKHRISLFSFTLCRASKRRFTVSL